jgi:hypothetical protein
VSVCCIASIPVVAAASFGRLDFNLSLDLLLLLLFLTPDFSHHYCHSSAVLSAEAAIGNVLDDVNVDADDEGVDATGEGDDEVAMAAAAAAAAVDASDGMAVVVDQAVRCCC